MPLDTLSFLLYHLYSHHADIDYLIPTNKLIVTHEKTIIKENFYETL